MLQSFEVELLDPVGDDFSDIHLLDELFDGRLNLEREEVDQFRDQRALHPLHRLAREYFLVEKLAAKEPFAQKTIDACLDHRAELAAQLFGIDRFLRERLFRGEFLYEKILAREAVQRVKRALITELVNLFPIEVEAATKQLVEKVNIRKIVADRVEQFDFERLERIVYRVARTELFWVEISGGVLGFLIGLLQVLFLWAMQA